MNLPPQTTSTATIQKSATLFHANEYDHTKADVTEGRVTWGRVGIDYRVMRGLHGRIVGEGCVGEGCAVGGVVWGGWFAVGVVFLGGRCCGVVWCVVAIVIRN